MLNMPAPAVMAAQRHAHNHRSIGCDPTQSWISAKKPRDAFLVVALCNLEALNSLPQLNCSIVIVDRKFSRVNRVLHVAPATLTCTERFLISAFLSCRIPSSCHFFIIQRQSGSDSDLDGRSNSSESAAPSN